MKKKLNLLIGATCAAAMMAPAAMAFTNITVPDGLPDTAFGGGPSGQAGEDQEVEQGAQSNQTWDYEAFVLDAGGLGIIAGFDMKSGVAGTSSGYVTLQGDIFVKIGAPVDAHNVSGAGADLVDYDYVIHFPTSGSWGSGVGTVPWEVYAFGTVVDIPTSDAAITGGTAHLSDWLWRVANERQETPIASGAANYGNDLADGAVGFAGGTHDYLMGLDLAWLGTPEDDVHLYTTMGCGNDILRGRINVTDGGMSVILLGLSLLGIAGAKARKA